MLHPPSRTPPLRVCVFVITHSSESCIAWTIAVVVSGADPIVIVVQVKELDTFLHVAFRHRQTDMVRGAIQRGRARTVAAHALATMLAWC